MLGDTVLPASSGDTPVQWLTDMLEDNIMVPVFGITYNQFHVSYNVMYFDQ